MSDILRQQAFRNLIFIISRFEKLSGEAWEGLYLLDKISYELYLPLNG